MKQVVVVIPIHKSDPTDNELKSFVQCFRVLGKHPIKVIAPEGLSLEKYKSAVERFETVFIENTWLSGIREYNKLKISPYFYNLFKEYEYLLTYELDAWVFKDELEYWCNKGYDYIGAPWFEGWHEAKDTAEIIGVGNSGFSLRNVQKAINILNRIIRIEKTRKFWYRSKLQAILRFEKIILRLPVGYSIKSNAHLAEILRLDYQVNEDYFWCNKMGATFKDYHISPVQNALQFSFDVNPKVLYSMNNNQLPFGCHAWERYEPEFWNEFIL